MTDTFVIRIVDDSGTTTPVAPAAAPALPKCETAAETLLLIQHLQQQLTTEHADELKTMRVAQRREYLRNYSRQYYREHREELLEKAKQKYYQRKSQPKAT